VILRARDADLGRDVAVKVLREDLPRSTDLMQRFIEEAQIGGRCSTRASVPVYDVGLRADGQPWFTMKLIRGKTFAAVLARGRRGRDLRRMLGVFEQVCQAVAYAHSRGVAHRDLKPSNIMWAPTARSW